MTSLPTYLAQVKGRLSKATPGPWYYYGLCGWLGSVIGTTPEETRLKTGTYPSDGDPDFSKSVIGVDYEYFHGSEEDCKLIASAPTDLTRLISMIEVAHAALSDIANHKMTSIDKVYLLQQCEGYKGRGEQALAELERLANDPSHVPR